MTVGYRIRCGPVPETAVEELERRLGRVLPPAYRAYLRQQNGGWLEDNNEAVKIVFGVGADPSALDLWRKLDVFAGRVPSWLLPVAQDEYGNLFCVSLRDADLGSVWFWDHEEEADEGEPPTEDNLTRRDDDWTAFLASLRPPD
jgi:hypothetical protein